MHMNKRCEEAGVESAPLTELEKLAYKYRNLYSTSTTRHESRVHAYDQSQEKNMVLVLQVHLVGKDYHRKGHNHHIQKISIFIQVKNYLFKMKNYMMITVITQLMKMIIIPAIFLKVMKRE